MKTVFYLILFAGLAGCATTVKGPSHPKKYSLQQVHSDYALFRNILEESHPGLYWFTPKDSMDYYFKEGESMLHDSMQEPQFKNVLSYVLSHIRCGHTTARPSSAFLKKGDSLRSKIFPLQFKFWRDTAMITGYIQGNDSSIKHLYKGRAVAIDGRPVMQIVDSLFHYLSHDGYNETHLYQSLSNRGAFSNLFFTVYGYKPKYKVDYIDSTGLPGSALISVYSPPRDTTRRPPAPKLSRRERKKLQRNFNRKFTIDSLQHFGMMELNTFTKGNRLKAFFKSSFKDLKKENISNLVIDLRLNGGGSVTYSNLLTRYIVDHPFRIGDSLYAHNRNSRYKQYMKGYFWDRIFMLMFTHKGSDGNYHFRYYEKKYFNPKNKNHYNGDVYVLIGGNTFSASTLFARAVKPQGNVILVGEETGGGEYGNNAWLIPDVTLPITKVRFRLPVFRLVTDKNLPRGHGVQPEIFAGPTVESIKRNVDFKMEVVRKMIGKNTKPSALH
jgi:hypothetical protein